MINYSLLYESLPALLHGAALSLGIAFLGLAIGTVGGVFLALCLLYGNQVIRIIANAYVTIVRGTPMLVQVLALFYIVPHVGITLSAFWTAVLAIGLNSIAYLSQIIRAGIEAIGKGQIEAAQTLGFTRWQNVRLILLPQAIRIVFPALGNECVTLIKDSSLASVIGVSELTHQGSLIMSRTYDAVTIYAGIGLIYLCITSCLSLLLYVIEKRFNHAGH